MNKRDDSGLETLAWVSVALVTGLLVVALVLNGKAGS